MNNKIGISYDVLTSNENSSLIVALERKDVEFIVSLDKKIPEEVARKTIDTLGIKNYRFMNPNEINSVDKVIITDDQLVEFVNSGAKIKNKDSEAIRYFFLAIFPITGILGIHDLYKKKYFRFALHALGALLMLGTLIYSQYTLNNMTASMMEVFMFLATAICSYVFAFIEGVIAIMSRSVKNQGEATADSEYQTKIGTLTIGIVAVMFFAWAGLCLNNGEISNLNSNLLLAATIPVSAIGAFFASKKRNAIYVINFYMTLVEIAMLVLFLLGIAVV